MPHSPQNLVLSSSSTTSSGSRAPPKWMGLPAFPMRRCRTWWALPAGGTRFTVLRGPRVRARKPSSLALRAGEREPNRGPGRFFCSLADRNRRKGFSYICRKMFRLRFQKIFCRYSNFSGLCSRNSSKGLFNDFSETFQVRTTF